MNIRLAVTNPFTHAESDIKFDVHITSLSPDHIYTHFMSTEAAYKVVFGTSPFPFWFTVNCIWVCHIIHISYRRRNFIFDAALNFVITFLAVFIPRELYAFVMYKPSPIGAHPASLAIHGLISALYTFAPGDIFAQFISTFSLALGLLQGAYQMRTLCFGLRNITYLDGFGCFICSALWATIDQLVMSVVRTISGARPTSVTGILYWIRTIFVFTAYWAVTHENTLVSKPLAIMPTALAFAFVQGIGNAASLVKCRRRKVE